MKRGFAGWKQALFPSLAALALGAAPQGRGATFTVQNTLDSGVNSLRWAIICANTNAGADRIEFNIPGSGPFLIQPATPLPPLTGPTVVDATTQPGYAGAPRVQIDGANASGCGLQLDAGSSAVRGLSLTHWPNAAIRICGPRGGNTVAANYIGLSPAGANGGIATGAGIMIYRSADNVIGGFSAADRNIISGSNLAGIFLTDPASARNRIVGNYIGLSANGSNALGATDSGVYIFGATATTIGGSETGAANVISGNQQCGVTIANRSGIAGQAINTAVGNLVAGNFIGTDPAGARAIGNSSYGVLIDGASSNIIGGAASGSRNILSGNKNIGVGILQATSVGNQILGNYIGLAEDGSTLLSNGLNGVYSEGPGTVIGGSADGAGNAISGNGSSGVRLANTATNSLVQGNLIGTDASGVLAAGNGAAGIFITNSPAALIGGATTGAANIIANNRNAGIRIDGAGAISNVIQGNRIGVNRSGAAAGNGADGIAITNAPGTIIGGADPAARNIISANGGVTAAAGAGIYIGGAKAGAALIQGNYIGTSPDGLSALPNLFNGVILDGSARNVIGGALAGTGNVISGNQQNGVFIDGAGAFSNVVQGNLIGLAADRHTALGNKYHGIHFNDSARSNFVGGSSSASDNRIAFNGASSGPADAGYDGIRVRTGCVGNFISRNSIFSNNPYNTNTSLGIDWGADGVTLTNVPVLSTAVSDGSQVQIIGNFTNAGVKKTYLLQFYANDITNGSGYGEGKTFLGSLSVTTDASGGAPIAGVLAAAVAPSRFLSVTATDPAGTTFEFSRSIGVISGSVSSQASSETAASQILSLDYTQTGAAPVASTAGVQVRVAVAAAKQAAVAATGSTVTLSETASSQYSGPALVTLMTNGPASNRLNIVFLSEGYTSNELAQFLSDARSSAQALLSYKPYNEYTNYINVFAIVVASAQSGSSHPGWPLLRDTYFNSSYDATLDNIISLPPNSLDTNYANGRGKIDALIERFIPGNASAMQVLLINELVPGGSGGNICIAALGEPFPETIVHESGHTLGKLGDEYTASRDYASSLDQDIEPNTTTNTVRSKIKWNAWIDADTSAPTPATLQNAGKVGLFQGAHYHATGWYRPKLDCVMRQMDSGAPFCEVCSEALVKAVYARLTPINAALPATNLVIIPSATPTVFSVAPLAPSTHALSVQWYLNSNALTGATNLACSVASSQLSNAIRKLTVRVSDPTALVRTDPSNLLSGSLSWTVVPQGVPIKATLASQPVSQRVRAGDTAQFSVQVAGSEPFTFQWRANSTAKTNSSVLIAGANAATLTISNAQPADARYYYVEVTNAYGRAVSASARLDIDAQVEILSTGPGSVSPNYNGQWLHVGSNYTVTAIASNKCVFSNWTGISTSKTAKITFKLQTNLVLGAVFADRVAPTLTVSSPTNNARLTNALIVFAGKATDNLAISSLQYRLNGGEWLPALSTNSWTNWTAPVWPIPGPNRVDIIARDLYSNAATQSLVFTYVVRQQVTVHTNGNGKTSITNGQVLELAKAYTNKATAATNWLFAGWDSGNRSNVQVFTMASNLVITANFVTNPFIALKGNYNGLYQPDDSLALASAGFAQLTLADSGAFTGSLMGATKYAISDKFWVDGSVATKAISGKKSLSVNLQLDLTNGSRQIAGTVADSNWTAQVLFNKAASNAVTPGTYTVRLAAPLEDDNFGDGYGRAAVSASGALSFTGVLSDGTSVSQSAYLSKDSQWPLFAAPYSASNGWVLGWTTFTNAGDSSLTGQAVWLRTAVKSGFQTNGFANDILVSGSTFTNLKTRALAFTNAELILSGGGIEPPITNAVLIKSNNVLSVLSTNNKLSLSLTASNGAVSGSFLHPVTRATLSLRGILLQQEPSARGFFVGKTNSGAFWLKEQEPTPDVPPAPSADASVILP